MFGEPEITFKVTQGH